ncbi:MAG: HEAT repeat domain-containing protein, partial [SAR202 cluster bacterium]|nr:HEAT repeat domain-containing protein [SAR202 cluster bacterium]
NHHINDAYNSHDIMLTSSAIYAMGETDNINWLNTVITETYNDLPEIRYESAIALGKLGNESVLPNIKELLNDEDIEVQNCAIESLGIIGGPIAKKMLLSLPSDLPEIKESLELALENLES